MLKTIKTNINNQVLTITLNRPEIRNAMNPVLIQELTHVFTTEATHGNVRVILLNGAGKVFSAGADLNWMKESVTYTKEKNIEDAKIFSNLLSTMRNISKPFIGIAHGAVMGGGIGFLSTCDYVLALEETLFSFSEARLGLIPAVIGPFVTEKIGISQAKALFLTAEKFSAKRAFELGLVHQLAPTPDDLLKKTEEIVNNVLSCSPNALKTAKCFLDNLKNKNLKDQEFTAINALAEIRVSDEAQEGVSAFLEKRKPNWIK